MWLKIMPFDATFCEIVASQEVKNDLDAYFSFMTPGAIYNPRCRPDANGRRGWDGKIRLFSFATGKIYFGLIPEIVRLANFKNWKIDYSDLVFHEFDKESLTEYCTNFKKNNPGTVFEARDYHVKALFKAAKNGRNTYLSATGSGKSAMIFLLCDYFKDKKIKRNAKEGFYFGLVLIIIGFILDGILFTVGAIAGGTQFDVLAYYTSPFFWAALVLVVITTTIVGAVKGKK